MIKPVDLILHIALAPGSTVIVVEVVVKFLHVPTNEFRLAIDDILHQQKIDIFKIQQLNELLKQRLQMPTDVDLLYKLASICFFDKSENPAVYEPAYAEKKIAKWRKDKGVRDFFMQTPLLELMPFLKSVNTDLDTFSELQKEIKIIHSECLRLASSAKK